MQTDQEKFDEQVRIKGRLVLQILAGTGIVAALTMSIVALVVSGNATHMMSGGTAVVPATVRALPASASVTIDHVTRGCHTLAVNGGAPGSPSRTLHLTAGGLLHVRNNDVMPQRLVRVAGPPAQFVAAAMNHMGASGTVTFPTAGTYSLTTKPGEDYASGVHTIGPDNTLRIKVVVSEA
jgi:hypothetical protein